MESMIDTKKEIVEKWVKDEIKINKKKKKDDSPFMMHFGEPGEA